MRLTVALSLQIRRIVYVACEFVSLDLYMAVIGLLSVLFFRETFKIGRA